MQLDKNNHTEHLRIIYTHFAMKGFQLGSVVAPLYLFARHRKSLTTPKLLRGAWKGALIGGIVSVAAGALQMMNKDGAYAYKRAYILLNHVSQNRVDKYSLIGAGIVGVLATVLIKKPVLLVDKTLGGATFGMLGGIFAHILHGGIREKLPVTVVDAFDDAKDAVTEWFNKKN